MKNEARVFIAGSRRLSRLGKEVLRRLDNIIEKGLTVLVGDANGVDKAVQRYLGQRHYGNVIVYCMEGGCRNNLGHWPTRTIGAAEPSRRDFAYYSSKDRAMVRGADYGLMLWDGRSRGTLTSIIDLVKQEKPVVVYVAGDRCFFTLRQSDELAEMLKSVAPAALHTLEADLRSFALASQTGRRVDTAPLF